MRAFGYAHAEAMRLGAANKLRQINAAQNIGPLITLIASNYAYEIPHDILPYINESKANYLLSEEEQKNPSSKTYNQMAIDILRDPPPELINNPEILGRLKEKYGVK